MNKYFIKRKNCPCCGLSTVKEIYRASYNEPPVSEYLENFYSSQGGVEFKYLENQDFVVCECIQCGLAFQKEIPSDFVMQMLYDKWIDPDLVFENIEKNRGIGYFSSISSEVIRIIRQFNVPPSQLDFLDYSMGWGHWTRIAQSLGCNVHGTEFSSARVEHAKKIGVTTLGYNEILDHRYDFINTEQVFEHLPEPKKVLLHLKKCLKPNGLLKISVPNGSDIKRRLKINDWKASKGSSDSLNPIAPMEHLNCFTRETLLKFVQEAGFSLVDIGSEKDTDALLWKVKTLIRPYYHMLKGNSSALSNMENNIYLIFSAKR